MAEEVGSFLIGLVVGIGLGLIWAGECTNKGLRNPTVTITTTSGITKVTVNGVEVDRQKIEDLKATYERLLAEWPKEDNDGQ